MKTLSLLLLCALACSCASLDTNKTYTVVYAYQMKKRTKYTIASPDKRLYVVYSQHGKLKGDSIKFKNK